MTTRMGIPSDLSGRFRRQATPYVPYVYVIPRNFRFAVPQNQSAALQANPVPCTAIMIQAENANGAIVNFGGPDTTVLSGTELTGGQAALIYPGEIPGDYLIRTALGTGIERLQAIGGGAGGSSVVRVVSPSHIFTVSVAAGQFLRVTLYPVTI